FGRCATVSGGDSGPLTGMTALALAWLTALASALAVASALALALAVAAVLAAVCFCSLSSFSSINCNCFLSSAISAAALSADSAFACDVISAPIMLIAAAVHFAFDMDGPLVASLNDRVAVRVGEMPQCMRHQNTPQGATQG